MFAIACYFTLVVVAVSGATCPSGGEIYTSGISKQGRIDVVNAHNSYRQQIMNGQVSGQPRGRNLKKMFYDTALGEKGRAVSKTCKMDHRFAGDNRWNWVGQNLYISWTSYKTTAQDWKEAVKYWFDEHKYFSYPNQSRGVTGHYTQVVWANSEYIGCDFIAFYDWSKPQYPYARLYTCNYGPGGNYEGEAPYQRA